MGEVKRLFDVPYFQLEKYPNENMFVSKENNKWHGISTKNFLEQVNLVSRGLISLGISPNDKVAIASSNRVEWNIMDIAIQQTGAIVVPIYPNISIADYEYIFNDAGIKLCVVDSIELYDKINIVKEKVDWLKFLYTFNKTTAPNWSEISNQA